MVNPTPGEPFEAHGLTWEPRCPGVWGTDMGAELRFDPWQSEPWQAQSFGMVLRFDTAELALQWAIRTCPGARCGSCAYHRNNGCVAEMPYDMPNDGFCHQWEARQ